MRHEMHPECTLRASIGYTSFWLVEDGRVKKKKNTWVESPSSLCALAIGAQRVGDYSLSRLVLKDLERLHGVRLVFLKSQSTKANSNAAASDVAPVCPPDLRT